MKRAVILLADGFEEVEAVTPFDYLRRAGVKVEFAGIGSRQITSSRGMVILADGLLDAVKADDFDAVVIPGGLPGSDNIGASDKALKLIQSMAVSGRVVAAICAAPVRVLSRAGLLKGRKFTCSPGMETEAPEGIFSGDRVVVDGNLITSRGAGTSGEFALALVTLLTDRETAAKIAHSTLQRT